MSLWSFWILLQRRNTEGVKLSQNTWQRGESYTFSTKKQNLILLFKRLGSGRTRNTNQLLFPAYTEMATAETVRKELLPCRNWLKEPETKNVKWNVKYRNPTRRGYVAKATWHSKKTFTRAQPPARSYFPPNMTQTKYMTFKGGIYSGKKTDEFHSGSNTPFFRLFWEDTYLF